MKIKINILLLIIPIMLISNKAKTQSAFEYSKKMIAICKTITAMRFTLKTEERIEGKMFAAKYDVKVQMHPLKIYQKQEYPQAGLEVLYKEGENGNDALINTNGFPWVNVNLNPMGSRMRENQHHTLYEIGFQTMMGILESLYTKYQDKAESMMSLQGSTKWDGHDCYIIKMENPSFGYKDYIVKEGEDLLTIAKKYHLSEHMILEYNDNVNSYSDVSAGDIIKIPEDYAKGMELYLDKKRYIPLVINVFDDKGLYECYEYFDVIEHASITPEEFNSDYKDYGF